LFSFLIRSWNTEAANAHLTPTKQLKSNKGQEKCLM
jgi:hypothetical protein